jgi:Holliday junction resolvase RusA-like endonuclease
MFLNDLDNKLSRIFNAMYSLSVFANHEQVKKLIAEKKKQQEQ